MQHLKTIQTDLKNRIPQEGITAVIKALKELLPEEAPKRNTLLQLEAAYNDVKLKGIEGILSDEALMLANNQIRKRLIELIDSLEADDFNINLKRSRLRPDNKIKQGHVLYRIPHQMQLQKEVKCIVRIALDKISLVEDIDVDEHTQVRSEVRVSDYMKVLLIDPAASPAFAIRSTSEPVQFIDEDAATEWKFYVTPLLPGEHILELKVVVMEIINGVERVREKSLEESVVIVTEAVEEMDDAPLQSANMDFVTSDPAYALEKTQSGYRLPKALRTGALVLAALMVVSTATFAFIPPVEQRWLMTRYWYDTPEAYEQFINENPNSKRVDDASFRKAKLRQSPQELQQFIETFDNSEYKEQAEIELQKLEEKAWQEVQSVTEPAALQQFLEVFPKGKRADDATWKIAEITQAPEALQEYLEKYPQGEKVQEAVQKLDDPKTWETPPPTSNKKDTTAVATEKEDKGKEQRLWNYVKSRNIPEAYENYLRRYPNGQFSEEAYNRLNQLTTGTAAEKEARLWQFVQQQNNAKGYEEYLKRYANGKFNQEAKTRLEALQPKIPNRAKTILNEEKTQPVTDSPSGGRGAMVLVKESGSHVPGLHGIGAGGLWSW